jgi:hypothetical protein
MVSKRNTILLIVLLAGIPGHAQQSPHIGIYPSTDSLFPGLFYRFKVQGSRAADYLLSTWTYYGKAGTKLLVKPLQQTGEEISISTIGPELMNVDSVKVEIIDPKYFKYWEIAEKKEDTAFIHSLMVCSKTYRTWSYLDLAAHDSRSAALKERMQQLFNRAMQVGTHQFPFYHPSQDAENAWFFANQFEEGHPFVYTEAARQLNGLLFINPQTPVDRGAQLRLDSNVLSTAEFLAGIDNFKVLNPSDTGATLELTKLATAYCDETSYVPKHNAFLLEDRTIYRNNIKMQRTDQEAGEYNKEMLKRTTDELSSFVRNKNGFAIIRFYFTARQNNTGIENEFSVIIKVQ